VIDLLKAVKKKEVQKQGVKSMTQRPMVGKKFQNLHKILRVLCAHSLCGLN
jgi:hypothetical protein